MLLELIAIALIILGIFLIFRGLTESYEEVEWYEPRKISRFEEEIYEPEFEEERRRKKKTEVKAGGVVLIGPIPIVFGESRFAVYALILTIILMLMAIMLMFAPYWR